MDEEIKNVAEDVKDVAVDAAEDVADVAKDVKDVVAHAAEDVGDAAGNVVEAVENKAGDIKEAVEDKFEDIKEAVEDKVEEVKAQVTAKKTPEIKMKKNGLNATSLITIIVCAVIVLACVAFCGWKLGWFHVPAKNVYTLEDYSKIEVLKSDVEVTDEDVDSYINGLINAATTTETITEGVVEDGDKLNIDYKGVYADNLKAFDGGTATGQSLTIGSGTFIPGFEDGLIGCSIGDTVDLPLTFPDEYENNPDLAGVDVIFTVTINSKSVTNTPELNDEFAANYAAENLPDENIATVDELKEYVRRMYYDTALENALLNALRDNLEVKSYDEEIEANLKRYAEDSLIYYSQMYGIDLDTLASYYGYDTAEEYSIDQAHTNMDLAMIFEKICQDKGITSTPEEVDAAMQEYIEANGYGSMSLEEFKETSGETWCYLYENLEYKYDKVIDAIKGNAVFVDAKAE